MSHTTRLIDRLSTRAKVCLHLCEATQTSTSSLNLRVARTMPRQIAPQVVDSVSRLLSGQYLKTEPLWYKAVTEHPPPTLPPRSFRDSTQKARYLKKLEEGGRPTKKERRLAQPRLSTTKITYLEDKVRDQFYHDHPWEGKRPRILLETEETVSRHGSSPRGRGLELRHWGRNPGPEE